MVTISKLAYFNNLWPTSRWRPGDHLADRYDIPSDPNAPLGEYQLLVGMYNPQTGDRLVITANDAPVADNAITLTRLQLATRP
jgi:hypothetical protein